MCVRVYVCVQKNKYSRRERESALASERERERDTYISHIPVMIKIPINGSTSRRVHTMLPETGRVSSKVIPINGSKVTPINRSIARAHNTAGKQAGL